MFVVRRPSVRRQLRQESNLYMDPMDSSNISPLWGEDWPATDSYQHSPTSWLRSLLRSGLNQFEVAVLTC